jgi:VCBS repeat-containing protein
VAVNDAFSLDEDNTLTTNAPGVLGNDTDANLDALTASLVTNAANGTVTLNPNGSFSYTPNPNFNGTDTFTYRVSDGILTSNIATVTLTVNAVNDAPVGVNDSFNALQNRAFTINANSLLANDSDIDGDTLQVIGVSNALNGTVSLAGNSITFTPNPGFLGSASFNYTLADGQGGSDDALVNLNINPLTGTSGRDNLTGTNFPDTIIGGPGADNLTGGAEADRFVYNSIVDGGDTITDFTVGSDKIILTNLLTGLGYSGTNPIADSVVRFSSSGTTNSLVQIDADGLSPARAINLIRVLNVGVSDLSNPNNFEF